jgi:hypothetical protein
MSPTHLLDALFLYLPLVEILPHEIDRERERENTPLLDLSSIAAQTRGENQSMTSSKQLEKKRRGGAYLACR